MASTSSLLKRVSPMLTVSDMAETVSFYRDVLGFGAMRMSPKYWIMERDGQAIHFQMAASQDVMRYVRGHTEIYLEITGIYALWDHVRTFKSRYQIRDLFDRDYGMTEFHICDPNGCLVFVGEPTPRDAPPLPQPAHSHPSLPERESRPKPASVRSSGLTHTISPGEREFTVLLKLNGPLTLATMRSFQDEFRDLKPLVLILDLTEVPYMDSAGLGLIMNNYVSAQYGGRRLLLAGVNERVRGLLRLTRVYEILPVFHDVAAAEAGL